MWQDVVIMLCQIVLAVALIPMLFYPSKPPLKTSFGNSAALITMGFCFLTLELLVSAVSVTVIGFLWFILAIQRIINSVEQ